MNRRNQVTELLNQYIECNTKGDLLHGFIAPISRGYADVVCIDGHNIRVCTYDRNGNYRGGITFDDVDDAALFLVNLDIDLTNLITPEDMY